LNAGILPRKVIAGDHHMPMNRRGDDCPVYRHIVIAADLDFTAREDIDAGDDRDYRYAHML
jgi:hypothetical protein